MQITLPNLAVLANDMHLPVNTSVGPQRRKWEVVRDYVIAQDHVHLRAEACIDGIDPHWDAIRQCYHLNRPYDWDGLLMRVQGTLPAPRLHEARDRTNRRARDRSIPVKRPPPRRDDPTPAMAPPAKPPPPVYTGNVQTHEF